MMKLKPLPLEINGIEVIKDLGMNNQIPAKRIAQFRCNCGRLFVGKINAVKVGHKSSCGCKRDGRPTHGLSRHPLYRKWSGMITRTTNSNEECYHRYGGRGIKVCDEWRNDFKNFYDWAISNGYKDGLTIDRIDVNGNYEPSNCQWLTMRENTIKDQIKFDPTEQQKKDICELYTNSHITVTEICKIYKTHTQRISEILKDNNIEVIQRRMKK